uniref:Uncharacterized protein n=1 Tax=Globodera rostochiensis TaxID=31243 RepID=A0A914I8S2_GLORO
MEILSIPPPPQQSVLCDYRLLKSGPFTPPPPRALPSQIRRVLLHCKVNGRKRAAAAAAVASSSSCSSSSSTVDESAGRRTSNDEDDNSRRLRPFLGKNPGGDKRSDQQLISMFGDGSDQKAARGLFSTNVRAPTCQTGRRGRCNSFANGNTCSTIATTTRRTITMWQFCRHDICRATNKYDTLGLAELGPSLRTTACQPRSPSRTSLATCSTFRMTTSGSVPSSCRRSTNTVNTSWCPRWNGMAQTQCLFDKPTERRYYEKMFETPAPGAFYTVSQQCKFVFGAAAEISVHSVLSSIVVLRKLGVEHSTCLWPTRRPAGTTCGAIGDNVSACRQCSSNSLTEDGAIGGHGESVRAHAEKVLINRLGIRVSKRHSGIATRHDPRMAANIVLGSGSAIGHAMFRTAPGTCPVLMSFNDSDIGIHGVPKEMKWAPKYTGVGDNERCRLYCRGTDSAAFYLLKDTVADGRPCDRNGDDICIDGTCHKAGCDHRLGSEMKRDVCGVCGGNGSSCRAVNGLYNERSTFGYNEVLRIPAGNSVCGVSAPLDQQCHGKEQKQTEKCSPGPCPYWRAAEWGQCSVRCGQSFRTRHVECVLKGQIVDDSLCMEAMRPKTNDRCVLLACAIWNAEPWSSVHFLLKHFDWHKMSKRKSRRRTPRERKREQTTRKTNQESSESDSEVGSLDYSELESEDSDTPLSPISPVEIAEEIEAGNFANLKTLLFKSMAEQSVRQWNVDDEDEVYSPNLNVIRGRALIINNHKFTRMKNRDGTNVDRERMFHLLKLLRYDTTIKDNLRARQMLKAVAKFSKEADHNSADSVVLVILTHGSSGKLFGIDDKYCFVDDLLGPLNNKNCGRLAGKPKLIFLQCCRGGKTDTGVSHGRNESATRAQDQRRDSPRRIRAPSEQLRRLPTDADFLICFSTTDYRVSWRSRLRGSRFIQAICECFARYAAVDDVLHLMTRVNGVVAAMYSNRKLSFMQVSEERYTLTKLFFFFPNDR